jgi:hypothetical protein
MDYQVFQHVDVGVANLATAKQADHPLWMHTFHDVVEQFFDSLHAFLLRFCQDSAVLIAHWNDG